LKKGEREGRWEGGSGEGVLHGSPRKFPEASRGGGRGFPVPRPVSILLFS
jgi:hypothetical protein